MCTTKIVWSRIFVLALIMRETGREPVPWTTRRLDFRDPWMGLLVADVIIARSGAVPIFLSVIALGIWQAREAKLITTCSSAWWADGAKIRTAVATLLRRCCRADRGRFVIYRIAGKDYTTLANIRRMIDQCPKWFRCARRSSNGRITHAGTWLIRDDRTRKALAVALMIAEGLSMPSPTMLPASRSPKRPRGNVMPLPSRVADVCRWWSERRLVAAAVGAC